MSRLYLLALVPALVVQEADPAGEGPPKSMVAVAPVARQVFSRRIELLGEVEAIRETIPSAEVEGLVLEVLADEGDPVREGQVLLRLDTGPREIQKRRVGAELLLAREQLREYRAGSRKEEIRQAEEAVKRTRTLKEEAERDLKRAKSLWETAMASEQEFTAAQAGALAAEHLYQENLATYELVKAGPRVEVIARAEAQVAIRQTEVDRIEDEIRRSEIRAPFDGIITEKVVEKGGYVNQGDPAFSLVQMNPIRITLTVPENAIDRIKKGLEISITLDAIPGEEFNGKVKAVIPLGDRVARTFPVKVDLENDSSRLLPGMAARASVSIPSAEPSLAIPLDAIVRTETGFLVYAVREEIAVMVPVEVGLLSGSTVEVRGELKEGDLVVVRGNERLLPNTPVQIQENAKDSTGPGAERPAR